MTEDVTEEFSADTIEDADAVDVDAAPEAETPDAPEPPAREWTDEEAEEAISFGWKPPDDWQGEKHDGFIDDPRAWMNRIKRTPTFQKMDQKLSDLEELRRKQEEMNSRALERQQREFQDRMHRITQDQRKAVEEADTDRWDALERDKTNLMRSAQEQQPQAPQQAPAEVTEYASSDRGAWLKNPILGNQAFQILEANPEIKRQPPKAQIEFAERELQKMYPGVFPAENTPAPKPRQIVDGGGLAGGAIGKQGAFGKLPADAKTQFKRFVEKGLFQDNPKDREEYANEYNSI